MMPPKKLKLRFLYGHELTREQRSQAIANAVEQLRGETPLARIVVDASRPAHEQMIESRLFGSNARTLFASRGAKVLGYIALENFDGRPFAAVPSELKKRARELLADKEKAQRHFVEAS